MGVYPWNRFIFHFHVTRLIYYYMLPLKTVTLKATISIWLGGRHKGLTRRRNQSTMMQCHLQIPHLPGKVLSTSLSSSASLLGDAHAHYDILCVVMKLFIGEGVSVTRGFTTSQKIDLIVEIFIHPSFCHFCVVPQWMRQR